MRALLDASGDDLARLVRPARAWVPGGDSDEAGLDVFARAAWSGIAEPGDVVAGLARRGLGPAVALRLAVECVVERGGGGAGRGLETALRDSPAGDDLGRFSVDAALRRWAPRLQRWRAEASLRAAEALDIRLLVPGDPGWPAELDELGDHAPAVLWLRGAGELPAPAASVAVVGARAATSYGETVAADLGSGLSDRGLTVVSGGAYGIDGSAHRAALAAEAATVAVMAGGADRFYPAGHDELLRRVVRTGLLVAEAPCGTTPSRWRFLQRNRLIACLTAATVVVEAGRRSGSLNTAGHAQVLGRPVGAVPGPVSSPSSAGCHALIRSGLATCVTGVDDVLELVGPIGRGVSTGHGAGGAGPAPEVVDPRVVRVQDALSPRVERTTDEVAAASGLGADTVRGLLAEMEVDGLVVAGPAGWRRRGRARG